MSNTESKTAVNPSTTPASGITRREMLATAIGAVGGIGLAAGAVKLATPPAHRDWKNEHLLALEGIPGLVKKAIRLYAQAEELGTYTKDQQTQKQYYADAMRTVDFISDTVKKAPYSDEFKKEVLKALNQIEGMYRFPSEETVKSFFYNKEMPKDEIETKTRLLERVNSLVIGFIEDGIRNGRVFSKDRNGGLDL